MSASQSLARKAYEALKHDVLTCELAPGTFVTEADLAQRYGVSKTPVREAVNLLVQEGFMLSVPRRGTLVRPIEVRDVQQTYFLRKLLEPAAAELAAERRTDETMATLKKLLAEIQHSEKPSDRHLLQEQVQHHQDFHAAIAEASGIPRLASMITSLHEEVARFMNANAHLGSRLSFGAWDQLLVNAIEKGDGAEARDTAEKAVEFSRQRLVETVLGVS